MGDGLSFYVGQKDNVPSVCDGWAKEGVSCHLLSWPKELILDDRVALIGIPGLALAWRVGVLADAGGQIPHTSLALADLAFCQFCREGASSSSSCFIWSLPWPEGIIVFILQINQSLGWNE